MLVALATHPGDLQAAQRLGLWMRDLGGCNGHDLFLIRDTRIEIGTAQALKDVFRESFDNVVMLDFVDHYKKWPHAPNACFGMVARHIGNTSKRAFLWIEPDCVFMQAGALDAIWNEYETVALQKGKVFMGCFVPGIATSPDHMSGIGVYPGELIRYAGNALIAGDRPWDLAAGSQIVPKCHFTKLISHTWRRQSFQTQEEVDASVPAEAVLYHSSKDGSLIRLLRERMNLAGVVEEPSRHQSMHPIGASGSPTSANATPADNLPGVLAGQSVSREAARPESAVGALSDMPLPHVPQSTEGGTIHCEECRRPVSADGSEYLPASGSQTETTREAGASDAGTPHVGMLWLNTRTGLTDFVPWSDKEQSLAFIKHWAAGLKRFCTAPRNTAKVRAILEEVGVIGHVAKKRRQRR